MSCLLGDSWTGGNSGEDDGDADPFEHRFVIWKLSGPLRNFDPKGPFDRYRTTLMLMRSSVLVALPEEGRELLVLLPIGLYSLGTIEKVESGAGVFPDDGSEGLVFYRVTTQWTCEILSQYTGKEYLNVPLPRRMS